MTIFIIVHLRQTLTFILFYSLDFVVLTKDKQSGKFYLALSSKENYLIHYIKYQQST